MGLFDLLCGCFGTRLGTDDIVDILSDEGGIQRIGVMHGLEQMTRADCTSCNTTAILIGKIVQGKLSEITKPAARLTDIMDGLQSRMAVVVNLKPEHWFTVLPDDQNTLVLLQSYQGLYDVGEWLRDRDNGKMGIQSFRESLNAVLEGVAPDDAVSLFARGDGDADTVRGDFSVRATIDRIYRVRSFKWNLK